MILWLLIVSAPPPVPCITGIVGLTLASGPQPGAYTCTASAWQAHNRCMTGPPQGWERQRIHQEMGGERAPVGFHMGALGHFIAGPSNLSLLEAPSTVKQPHSPSADLQAEAGRQVTPFFLLS